MKAFITGITGQDGYYLAKHLLENDYEVHGAIRRSSSFHNTTRIDGLISNYFDDNQLSLYYSDLLDASSLNNLINSIKPDEIYNLEHSHMLQFHLKIIYTTQTSTIGPLTLLEAVKNAKYDIKYYQASSSEMFGGIDEYSFRRISF